VISKHTPTLHLVAIDPIRAYQGVTIRKIKRLCRGGPILGNNARNTFQFSSVLQHAVIGRMLTKQKSCSWAISEVQTSCSVVVADSLMTYVILICEFSSFNSRSLYYLPTAFPKKGMSLSRKICRMI
jgi:hypothetical protein